jgi:streptogramin lyase
LLGSGASGAGLPAQEISLGTNLSMSGTTLNELIAEWYKVDGVRPRGAPMGLRGAADGAIWLVEDRNKSILRLDVDAGAPVGNALPCQ